MTKKVESPMSESRSVTIPMQIGFNLGLGIEPITGNTFLPLATKLPLKEIASFSEKRTYSLVSSASEYSKLVESVIRASASGASWSVSADVEYLNNTSISDTSLSFVVSSRVNIKNSLFDDDRRADVKVDQEALDILAQDVARFQERYGTHFIGGFIYGGSFLGQISINTHTSKQKESLKAAMKASISSFISGDLDASFLQDLNKYQSDYSVTASASVDGAVEEFNVGKIESMAKALNRFAKDLKDTKSEGNQLMAICYSWDRLPAIGKVLKDKDREFRLVDPGVVEELSEEIRKLDYLKANVNNLINNKCYVGSTQKNSLGSLKQRIGRARSKIQNLPIKELLNLSTDGVEQYQVADKIQDELNPIAQGRCTLNWQVSLDRWFVPVDQGTRTIEAIPSSNVVIVQRAHHHSNKTDWELGYFYSYVGADGKPNDYGKPKLKAYMNELKHGQKTDNGWVEPNTGQKATAQWTGADENKVTVGFGD